MNRLIAAALLAVLTATAAAAQCSSDSVELRGGFGTARFNVEVADDPQERGRGLMFVEEMAQSAGMLFVFPAPHSASFWMKNTLIPLDMIFLDRHGVVQKVHSNAIPHDETPVLGGDGILFVLEINGGLAERLGIKPGDALRHPSVSQDMAAWPCD